MRRALSGLGLLSAAALLSGCMVGPDYRRPDLPAPPAYVEAASTPQTAIAANEVDLRAWWRVFNDPALDQLIAEGLAGSPDLDAAGARLRQAREQERIAQAALLPQLNGSAAAISYNSNRKSPSSAAKSGSGAAGGSSASGGSQLSIPNHLSLYSVGFDATWEVDLFGGVRRQVEAAHDNAEAAAWNRRDGEVSLTGEIANDYWSLRAIQARIALAQVQVQRRGQLLDLIRLRRQHGFVTELDVNQQATQISTAAAELAQLQAQERVQMHALAVLVGQPPEALIQQLQATGAALPAPPASLWVGAPSDLLERRPDVRVAERQLAAANAQVGVQEANLYPKLNLLGLASFAGTSLGDLFSSNNLSSVGVGMVTAPIFTGGRTKAAIGSAKAQQAQALDSYRSTFLGALRDVEDALSQYRAEDARRAQLAGAEAAAASSYRIAQDQYRVGMVDFTSVLQAQDSLIAAQDQLSQSDGQRLSDLVALYKALGGGWSA